MNEVKQIDLKDLKPAPWKATYIVSPDLAVLARSIVQYGILSPIIVREQDLTIIDGHERYLLALNNLQIRETVGTIVPVIFVKCSEKDAMILHVQINRGRGSVVAKKLSSLIRALLISESVSEEDLCTALNMTLDELDVLVDGTIIKHRSIANHIYSRAWVPIESPTKITNDLLIETPPNGDR